MKSRNLKQVILVGNPCLDLGDILRGQIHLEYVHCEAQTYYLFAAEIPAAWVNLRELSIVVASEIHQPVEWDNWIRTIELALVSGSVPS